MECCGNIMIKKGKTEGLKRFCCLKEIFGNLFGVFKPYGNADEPLGDTEKLPCLVIEVAVDRALHMQRKGAVVTDIRCQCRHIQCIEEGKSTRLCTAVDGQQRSATV